VTAFGLVMAASAPTPTPVAIDLGTLGGSSGASAVNDNGMVVGTYWTLAGNPRPFAVSMPRRGEGQRPLCPVVSMPRRGEGQRPLCPVGIALMLPIVGSRLR
jgi:hypothetical protein